jgi:hypothetical protein
VPLYNTFTEVWHFYSALKAIIFEVYATSKSVHA